MKTSEVLAVLRSTYQGRWNADKWAYFEELRVGTGYGRGVEQRIDAWAMHLWPSESMVRIAYEVKVSRADFLNELKNPLKRRKALLFSNMFFFVTPPGLVKPEEVPLECGLEEVHTSPGETEQRLKIIVPAPWRDNPPPPWSLFAAVARRIAREERQS